MRQPPLDATRCAGLLPALGERTALIFGNERTGLSHAEAARCERLVRLPTPGPVESLNLASAVAVSLSLCLSAAQLGGERRVARAGRGALQAELEAQLEGAGFYQRTDRAGFAPRLREMVDKMDLSERDAVLLAELLRCIGSGRDGAANRPIAQDSSDSGSSASGSSASGSSAPGSSAAASDAAPSRF